MDPKIQEKCDSLITYYRALSPMTVWDSAGITLAAASLCMAEDAVPDPERYRTCRQILRKKKGPFSSFRGFSETILCCRMALNEDPEACLDRIIEAETLLHGFFSGEQTVLAATVLADHADKLPIFESAGRTKEIYGEMKQAHAWMTSESDMPFAALMAVSSRDPKAIHDEAEANFQILKDRFRSDPDARQTLSHILSLCSGSAEEKCEKFISLADRLRMEGHSMGTGRNMVILGTLADSPFPTDQLVRDIVDADDCLKEQKPFRGLFGTGAKTRRMFAVQCLQCAYAEPGGASLSAAISSSVQTAVMLELMLVIMVASSTHILTASSHSSR